MSNRACNASDPMKCIRKFEMLIATGFDKIDTRGTTNPNVSVFWGLAPCCLVEMPIPVAARSIAWLLVSRVRIPLRAWIFVCCVYMLCCPV